jgi:hypothetical protein
VFLTGSQLYVRCNANIILLGGAQIVTAPTPASFAVLVLGAVSAVAATGVITLAFTPTPVPAGFNLVLKATAPMSQGRSFAGNSSFRYVMNAAAAQASPLSGTAAYAAVFGAITGKVGQKIFMKAYYIQTLTGLAGIPVRTSVIIT